MDCSDVENVFRLLVEAPPGVQKLGYADLLGSCGAPAAELCRDKLTSSTSSPRELGEALIVLGRFENGNDRALVVSFLDHEDIEVRQNAALAAARYDLGPEWGNIVSALEREQSLENKVLLVICVMKTRDPRGHEVLDRLESSTSAEELHRRTMFGSLQGSIEHARKYLPREPDPVPEGK